MDSFYIGHLKGVGKVYQLTAVDTATRWAFIQIVLGPVTAEHTRRFITQLQRRFRRLGWPMRAVLSDNGPEYAAIRFKNHLTDRGLIHHRIPPRSPNHNAVCERFQGTAVQECWRPAFHRRRFSTIRQLQAKPTPGSTATTTVAATTATSCEAAPRDKSSPNKTPNEHHDPQPQSPSVTSNPGPEALAQG